MDCPIIQHLEEWHATLSEVADFPSLEAKAEHIGLLNRVETAIARLKICETYDIRPSAWVCQLPPEINPEFPQPFYPDTGSSVTGNLTILSIGRKYSLRNGASSG